MTNPTRSGDSDRSWMTASTAPSSTENHEDDDKSIASTVCSLKKKELVVVPGSGRAGEALQVAWIPTGRRQRQRPKEEPWVPPPQPQETRPMTPTAPQSSYSCPIDQTSSPPWIPTLARSLSAPASPRDIVSESRNAWRITTVANDGVVKGNDTDKVDKVMATSLWERNAGGDWGILEATSPASSLSSNPFPSSWAYYNSNARDIFRSPQRQPPLPCDCERCRLYHDLMNKETLCVVANISSSMSTLTPDELLVMNCQCSKCYAAQQQQRMQYEIPMESLVLIHRSPSTDDTMSTLTPDVVDRVIKDETATTQHLEKASKGRRLLEAVNILLDVFAPNCCTIKPSRPGVLQPWHLLLPSAQPQTSSSASTVHHQPANENVSVMRLRGCYL